MAVKPFDFGGQSVPPGQRKTVNLDAGLHPDHTPATMPVHVVHGRRPGPTVCVTSGVHGDEIIGVEVVRRLLRAPSLDRLRGTLLVVPIVNTFGFLNRSRYLPDRRDLNRCFPGSPNGSAASRLAHVFMTEVIERCSTGIDLHSAAIHRSNLPQIRIAANSDRLMELANVFGAPAIIPSDIRRGSVRGEAQHRGVDMLLYEAGEALRFDETAARIGVMGVLRVLHALEMVPARGLAKPRKAPVVCKASSWLRAPTAGILRSYKIDGDVVRKDDLVATIGDPFGHDEWELLAPKDGIVIGRTVMPVVNEGDALFHIATVRSADRAENAVDHITSHLDEHPLFEEEEDIA